MFNIFKEKRITPELISKDAIVTILDESESLSKEKEKVEEPGVKWIWVEGYKAVNEDMTARDNFKYEVGKTYKMDDAKMCEYGFHFCLKLQDTRNYYTPNTSRFFKVKGLVKIDNENIRYNKTNEKFEKFVYDSCILPQWRETDKVVAKEIILIEEIDAKEIYNTFKQELDYYGNNNPTYEDFLEYRFLTPSEIKEKRIAILSKELVKIGYSESFANIFLRKYCIDKYRIDSYNHYREFFSNKKYKLALVLAEEGVSPDTRAYLLLKGE